MKKAIILLIIIFLFSFIVYQGFFKKTKPEFNLAEVKRGTVLQEVVETGQVKKGKELNLTFKNAGKIEKIYVEVGEGIKNGQKLAELENVDFQLQLQEAQAALDLAQLNLKKLLAGTRIEEIKIIETQVENAQVSLEIAEENLRNSYEEAMTVLDGSYPQIYNALNFVKEFATKYVVVSDEDGRKIINMRNEIEENEKDAKFYLEIAKNNSDDENVETALVMMKNSLETAFNSLEKIREINDTSAVYRNNVSAADRASLDVCKTNANNAFFNVVGAQQTISSMKLNVETAKTKLQEVKDNLDLAKAETPKIDIDLCKAQIRQAESRVQFYENQIQQSMLTSPTDGKIIEIKKRAGELVQPVSQDVVMVILPIASYEIEVDIYEEDVVKIKVGNPVDISLVAFPDQVFKGKVISIDPVEKLTEGVVYYKVTIDSALIDENGIPEGVKPGMTADVTIKTASKENVLVIPAEAIQETNGKKIVQVLKNGKIEDREVEIGLQGSHDLAEVISGLEDAEKIILK